MAVVLPDFESREFKALESSLSKIGMSIAVVIFQTNIRNSKKKWHFNALEVYYQSHKKKFPTNSIG